MHLLIVTSLSSVMIQIQIDFTLLLMLGLSPLFSSMISQDQLLDLAFCPRGSSSVFCPFCHIFLLFLHFSDFLISTKISSALNKPLGHLQVIIINLRVLKPFGLFVFSSKPSRTFVYRPKKPV